MTVTKKDGTPPSGLQDPNAKNDGRTPRHWGQSGGHEPSEGVEQ